MNPILGQVYVYDARTSVFDEISKRENKIPDYTDRDGKLIRKGQTIYRFAKNVEIDGVVKTFLFLSQSGNTKNAEKTIKGTLERVKDNSNLVEVFKKSSETPIAI